MCATLLDGRGQQGVVRSINTAQLYRVEQLVLDIREEPANQHRGLLHRHLLSETDKVDQRDEEIIDPHKSATRQQE